MERKKPLIAVTQGDPAGVGPEIIVGAWAETVVHDWCRPRGGRPSGDPPPGGGTVADRPARRRDRLAGRGRAVARRDSLHPLRLATTCWTCAPGTLDARAGQAAYDAVVTAARLALAGQVDAITTAPLHKEALHRAGHDYPGHTELLAELCGVDDFAMMLYLGPDDEICSRRPAWPWSTSRCTRRCGTCSSELTRGRRVWPRPGWPTASCAG